MNHPVSDTALDQLFRNARTANAWCDEDVPEVLIRAVYDLTKMGPTSANICPARFLWIRSDAAKQKLKPLLMAGNDSKVLTAPWTVIIAWDEKFEDQVPKLFPHNPEAKNWFSDPEAHLDAALRNSTLQGAYLMLAARALGMDCGPMSGFDKAGVDAAFFANDPKRTHWRSNFICALGRADASATFARSPRLSFEQAGEII
ncbi:Probable NADH dehydrogenase/NAD(P)H nitroreductase [hydrothermal vent metagenome]|uniref:Probable NADH dehydrogenase/NAD(P)H nitroreductase n=1 Tax=hydrothermal vent metagenome TaxID=652676 RepID=A0A3B0SK06_9ZZZZ